MRSDLTPNVWSEAAGLTEFLKLNSLLRNLRMGPRIPQGTLFPRRRVSSLGTMPALPNITLQEFIYVRQDTKVMCKHIWRFPIQWGNEHMYE